MIYNLYSIWDKKSKEFGPLMELKNDQVALRRFADILRQDGFKDNREDFQLTLLGSLDHETGKGSFSEKKVLDFPQGPTILHAPTKKVEGKDNA